MPDWRYTEAGQIEEPVDWLQTRSSALWSSIQAFTSNIERIRAFWKLTPELVEEASVNAVQLSQTIVEVTGQPFVTLEELNPAVQQEVIDRLATRVARRFLETGSVDEAAGYNFERALARFEEITGNNPTMGEAIYATLSAQLILGWTAFETLAGDVWKAARPSSLPIEGFKFQSLRGIREAYRAAFVTDGERVNGALSDAALSKLSFVRNLLVHKSGVVDQKFLDDAASISWLVSDEINNKISLDGARVRDLINPVIQRTEELILAVDEWLTAALR
jgi:hypothetical protein